jgi:hypothetical protein
MKYILGLFDIVFAMSLFFVLIYSYYLGVKHGMKLAKGEIPKVNPVESLKEYVKENNVKKELFKQSEKEKKESDLAQEGWYGENGIMNYDPYKVKKDGE